MDVRIEFSGEGTETKWVNSGSAILILTEIRVVVPLDVSLFNLVLELFISNSDLSVLMEIVKCFIQSLRYEREPLLIIHVVIISSCCYALNSVLICV